MNAVQTPEASRQATQFLKIRKDIIIAWWVLFYFLYWHSWGCLNNLLSACEQIYLYEGLKDWVHTVCVWKMSIVSKFHFWNLVNLNELICLFSPWNYQKKMYTIYPVLTTVGRKLGRLWAEFILLLPTLQGVNVGKMNWSW